MSNKKVYVILAILLGIIGIAAALIATGVIGNEASTRVAVEMSAKRDIIETVTASGKIYPVSEVKISPDVSGEITQIFVEEGDSVRRGQLLANINSTIYKSMVNKANAQLNQTKSSVSNANALMQQAKAQLDQAAATFIRNRELFEDKVISAVEFESAEGTYKSAQANYKAALENIKGNQFGVASANANVTEAVQTLHKTTIFSPMTGIVSALFIKKGERVVGTAQMAGTELMRVADMSKMKVDVEVGENDIQKVKFGDTANVEVEAYPSRKFKGLVVQISQSSTSIGALQNMTDQVTNYTVSVEIIPESYQDLLEADTRHFPFRPGMSASVEILTKHQLQILSVPINAVTTREDIEEDVENDNKKNNDQIKEYVFVINEESKTVLKEVKTGIQDNQYIQILSGLKEGEQVIVAPFSAIARTLKKDKKVKIVPKKDLFDKKEKASEE